MPEADIAPGSNALELIETQRRAAEIAVNELKPKLEGNGVTVDGEVLLGDPATEISRLCENPEMGVVIIGRSGKGAIARMLLGSVALTLVKNCPKPVIVVP
jgi:nucleotide-binding universal stress UspA family protein